MRRNYDRHQCEKTNIHNKYCKNQGTPRNIKMTLKYLKENNNFAVPFEKGIGTCLMKSEVYHNKLGEIISLPQFVKEVQKRKNDKHPVLKEEERITNVEDGEEDYRVDVRKIKTN